MFLRLLLVKIICITLYTMAHAQMVLPKYVVGKSHEGKLLIKWEPESIAEWQLAQEYGYDVKLSYISKMGDTPLKVANVKALSSPAFIQAMVNVSDDKYNYYRSAHDFLYPEQALEESVNTMINNVVKTDDETVDMLRLSMVSYFSIYEMDIAAHTGLGLTVPYDKEGRYKIEISVNNQYQKEYILDTRKQNDKLPFQLKAEFSENVVKLYWNAKAHFDKSYGFFIEKSSDGIVYSKTSEQPYLCARPSDKVKIQGVMSATDSLQHNYRDYFYRIRSFDYFGHTSDNYEAVSGYGFNEIKYSPRIVMANQNEDNTAYIEWAIEQVDLPLIDYFRVLRADSLKGNWEINIDTIPKQTRKLNIPMDHATNHYRVETVPIDGNSLSSTPVFVMGIDTIAPPTPEVISAMIDSTGKVEIKWHPSEASDLWGYRVFKSNFADQEYTLINANVTKDTVLIDTTHLNLGIKNVYYKILAADQRNNRSPFTEPIVLTKPDVMLPYGAFVKKLEQATDTVMIHWNPSPSDDVATYKIFRRNLLSEREWTLIQVLDTNNVVSPLIDTDIVFDNHYGYTIVTTDVSDLSSEPSELKTIYVNKPKEKFESINEFSGKYDKRKNEVLLSWDVNDPQDVETYLLFRGQDKDKLSRYKYLDGDQATYSESVPKDTKAYHYKIKPIYKNGKGVFYSDLVSVAFPEGTNTDTKEPKSKKNRKSNRGK